MNVAGRTDKDHARVTAGVGEIAVLAQETVARMNGVRTRGLRRLENAVDAEVRLGGRCLANEDGSIGRLHMRGGGVRLRIDGDGLNPHAPAGSDDANGDFTAIRDEDGPYGWQARYFHRSLVASHFAVAMKAIIGMVRRQESKQIDGRERMRE